MTLFCFLIQGTTASICSGLQGVVNKTNNSSRMVEANFYKAESALSTKVSKIVVKNLASLVFSVAM
jgi:hypothetical protein